MTRCLRSGRPVRHSVTLVATLAAALVLGISGCGSDAAQRPSALAAGAAPAVPPAAASGVAAAPAVTPAAPPGRLAETATQDIRPDAPLSGGSATAPAALAPVSLLVPRLGISTGLVRLGLLADGTMAVPASADVAGWYTGGPAPGQTGPAVLAGHVDSRSGPGVFYRLRNARPGDTVVVRRADRRELRFTVTDVQRFAKAAFPTDRVYGATPFPELRLVTCGGSFDYAKRHYRDNVVVFARQMG